MEAAQLRFQQQLPVGPALLGDEGQRRAEGHPVIRRAGIDPMVGRYEQPAQGVKKPCRRARWTREAYMKKPPHYEREGFFGMPFLEKAASVYFPGPLRDR